MSNTFDIVQAPLGLSQCDLPEHIELGVPFEVNAERYVLVRTEAEDLKVCMDIEALEGVATSTPVDCKSYFIIKKI